jgi:hypothetical protein
MTLRLKIRSSYIRLCRESWMDWDDLPPSRRWPVIWFILAHGAAAGWLLILFMAWLNSVAV